MVQNHLWIARLSLLLKHVKDFVHSKCQCQTAWTQTIPYLCPWNSYEQKGLVGIFLSLQNPFPLKSHAEKNLRAISENSREMYKILCEAEWFSICKWSNHFWPLLLNCIDTHHYSAFQLRTRSNIIEKYPWGWNLFWWAMSVLLPGEMSTPQEAK